MKRKQPTALHSQFEIDVKNGLSASPKHLSSKYIYDKKGDKLFQQIMNLPEYYLTNCEFNILEKHQDLITHYFKADTGFDFIELGAGDGKKTKILLRNLVQQKLNFKYLPIDISQHILDDLEYSLKTEIPDLEIETLQGTYFKVLEELKSYVTRKKVIIVLGSNIGNLEHQRAVEFLKNIQLAMNPQDMLFMGFDQKKDPQTILDAYNDSQGVTAAFNKNLLARINTELGGNFDLDNFKHWETYNPQTGTAKSFLVSTKEQRVFIEAFNQEFNFKAWEAIHCEISQKYDNEIVEWLAGEAGLKIKEFFTDDNQYYRNYIFVKK